jgi:hypothetical protein
MKVKNTRNKLLKNGFIAKHQEKRHDMWMDITGGGTNISFYHDGESLDGVIKIHGRKPDRPQYDEFNSSFCRQVKMAIMLSRT